jgi:signal transduction histidine kinase/response regulator RpfG family c-di-GMP phosphodiesterase
MSSDATVNPVNILLVDDVPENLLALEAILEKLGQNLVKARSGAEALRRLLEQEVALILLDVQMPGMDGLETAALIRQRDRSRHTPIIFLTAYEHSDVQIFKGYSLGAVDFLFKPLVPDVLRSKVGVFVELYQKTEQVREAQRQEHERQLAEERQRWEMERLRKETAQEKYNAELLAQKAEELRDVKDELAAQLADMTRLHQLSARLSRTLDVPEVLQEVIAAVAELRCTEQGLLLLHDRERNDLGVAASIGLPEEYLRLVRRMPLPAEKGDRDLFGSVIEDVEAEPAFAPYLPAARLAGYRAACNTPLLTRGGQVAGVAAVYFRHPHRPSQREDRLVELYARQAAEAIENARLHAEIRKANRRKDEFLALLAHELRNPLSPILNSLHIMRLSGLASADAEEARATAERQVRHMTRLVEDLLDVSRINQGKIQLRKERVDLATVVGRATENCRALIESRRHRLEVALPPEPLCLEADAVRLEQVFTNLLNNAAKYTEPGGFLGLTATRDGDEVVLRLRDNGVGIPPEMLESIFDLFTQVEQGLDRSTQWGLGIGLSLVRSLVELHGGRVEAHSAGAGQGSEFVVRLPALHRPVKEAASQPPPAASAARQRTRVLVVDDNEDAANSLAMVLGLKGHEVLLAYDGPSALEAARAHRPQAVVLDIALPGMDGHEVARRLRGLEETRDVLLVAMTGYGQAEDLRRSREAGFDIHLIKPVDPSEVQDVLARGMKSARAQVTPPAVTPGKG